MRAVAILLLFLAFEPTLASTQVSGVMKYATVLMSGVTLVQEKLATTANQFFYMAPAPVHFGGGPWIAMTVFMLLLIVISALASVIFGYKCLISLTKMLRGYSADTLMCSLMFFLSIFLGFGLVVAITNMNMVYYRAFVPLTLMMFAWVVVGTTMTQCVNERTDIQPKGVIDFAHYYATGKKTGRTQKTLWQRFACKRLWVSSIIMGLVVLAVMIPMVAIPASGHLYESCLTFKNTAASCNPGYSCDLSSSTCYHYPRQLDEPCDSNANPCDSSRGLTCLPYFGVCTDGSCGTPCLVDSDCMSNGTVQLSCVFISGNNPAGARICVYPGVADVQSALATCLNSGTFLANYNTSVVSTGTWFSVWEKYPMCRAAVVNQGCCGSCVLFACTTQMAVKQCIVDQVFGYANMLNTNPTWLGNVSAAMIYYRSHAGLIRGPRYVRLSEQALMQCLDVYEDTFNAGYQACEGSWDNVAHAVINKQGLPPYDDLTYQEGDNYWLTFACDTTALNGATCPDNTYNVQKGCIDTPITSFAQAQYFLENYGPIVGSLDGMDLQSVQFFYAQNVMYPGSSIDHEIMVYAWGITDAGVKYLVIQNSWGSSFGYMGEVRVAYSSFGDLRTCVPAALPYNAADVPK